jgi:hypothetical protein
MAMFRPARTSRLSPERVAWRPGAPHAAIPIRACRVRAERITGAPPGRRAGRPSEPVGDAHAVDARRNEGACAEASRTRTRGSTSSSTTSATSADGRRRSAQPERRSNARRPVLCGLHPAPHRGAVARTRLLTAGAAPRSGGAGTSAVRRPNSEDSFSARPSSPMPTPSHGAAGEALALACEPSWVAERLDHLEAVIPRFNAAFAVRRG